MGLRRASLLATAAFGAGAFGTADAQTDGPEPAERRPTPAQEIVVTGQIIYRGRTNDIPPVLEYGLDYFQPFEPLTVGDMLKRVPSAGFLSDVLEFDGVRLRGLDPGYTQILINGKRVPGSGVDRSFFVDRIPAELVERIEIVRSASANRSGDALAGTLNIILRDPYSLEGGFARAGALHFNDDDIKGVFGGVLAGPLGAGRGIVGVNIQGRHNPKEKQSFRYEPDTGVLEFDNREDQSDVRDGTDYSFNAEFAHPVGSGEIQLSGFYVLTDRTETENSLEYTDPVSTDTADLVSVTPQFEDIRQDNYSIKGELSQEVLGGETEIEIGFAQFTDDITATEEQTEYDPFPTIDDFGGTREFTDVTDEELSSALAHAIKFDGNELEFGVQYVGKERDALISDADISTPGDPYPPASPVAGGFYTIEETRIDPYVMLSHTEGPVRWEAGLRYETTESEITDKDAGLTFSADYQFLLPSAHMRIALTDQDHITLSGARTVRRPNFDFLAPAVLEEEPSEDSDFVGNPALKPESAWGFDIGYERTLGRSGIAGINFFYRAVEDLVELASTGIVSSSGLGFVLTPSNVGDGEVWGVEFDLSTPLTIVGLPDTGLFVNYSWLDSNLTDPVTGAGRRFNDQAKSVLNAGFIHDITAWGAAFGVTYRKQGDAFSRIQGETVSTIYSGDLEAFIEKSIGENLTLRFTGSNLLDGSKDETFFKWDTVADQLSGDIDDLDEFELETETSGPVFQLVARVAF